MNKIDDLIGRALTEEDRVLLASHNEPGYLAQAFGLFRGPMAWVMWTLNVASGVSFLAGVYAISRMFGALDPLVAVSGAWLHCFCFR